MFMLPEEVLRKQAVSTTGYTNLVAARQLKFRWKGRFLEKEMF